MKEPSALELVIDRINTLDHQRKIYLEIAGKLAAALELIAAGERPDGTYNRSRKACEVLAKHALKDSNALFQFD